MAKPFRLLLDTLVQTNRITWSSDDWRVRWSLACRQRFPGMKIFGCHQGLCICHSIVILNLMFLFQHPSNLRFISLLELLFAQQKFLFALVGIENEKQTWRTYRWQHLDWRSWLNLRRIWPKGGRLTVDDWRRNEASFLCLPTEIDYVDEQSHLESLSGIVPLFHRQHWSVHGRSLSTSVELRSIATMN